jgi:hypothetical protein
MSVHLSEGKEQSMIVRHAFIGLIGVAAVVRVDRDGADREGHPWTRSRRAARQRARAEDRH